MQVKSSSKSLKAQVREMQHDSSVTLRLQALSKELIQQQAYNRLWLNQDFQQYLLPTLNQVNKWLDPQSFKDDKEFQRAYNVIWAKATVSDEVIKLLSGSETRVRAIQTQIEQEKLRNGIE